jgi:hypothetical protein
VGAGDHRRPQRRPPASGGCGARLGGWATPRRSRSATDDLATLRTAAREELAREVRDVLDRLHAGRPVTPRTAALALLAHFAQLPAAATPTGGSRLHSLGLKITAAGIAPLAGLADAVFYSPLAPRGGGGIWGAGAGLSDVGHAGGCGGGWDGGSGHHGGGGGHDGGGGHGHGGCGGGGSF